MKMIFQDPISSLNPRRKVEDLIAEGLQIWKIGTKEEQQKKVDDVMLDVGLDPELQRGKRPHQFSGGQCQRISIARAVVTDPKLIICDEPVSALDVSVQAQILNLLEDMKHRYGLTLMFIAHDLAVVKNVSDRVVVMYLGKICEVGTPTRSTSSPRIRTRPRCSRRSRSRTRTSGPRTGCTSAARSRRRLRRRAAAGSARGARRRRSAARPRSRRSARSRPASTSRATSRLTAGETLPNRNGSSATA